MIAASGSGLQLACAACCATFSLCIYICYIFIYIVCSCGVHKRLRGRDVFKGHPAEEGQGAQHMPEQEQCWRCTPCPHGSRRSKRRPEPRGGGRAAEAAHRRQRRRQRPRTTDQTHPIYIKQFFASIYIYICVCVYICVSIIPSKAGLPPYLQTNTWTGPHECTC